MTVYRDDHGIPHVRAGSLLELAREQGRVTAHDRAWQLETDRLQADGRLATLLGTGAVEWDAFARRIDVAGTARRAFAALDEESRGFVSAYVGGVNAAFAEGATAPELTELGSRPGRWEPWTPLAAFLVQQVLFGNFPTKLWRHRVRTVLGEEALALFTVEGLSGGSNAFAVGGGRTASGRPIVAGDPHRTFEAPNVYQQVRLSCPEVDVVGYAFPGVPGVQHFGHAGEVAWAITNAVADYQDLCEERLERDGDRVLALGPDGPEPVQRHVERVEVRAAAPVDVEVLVTARGPVVVGGPDSPEAFSVRTTSGVLGDLGLGALLALMRARSVEDVDRAFDQWVEPVNNVVVADTAGRVLHRVAGRVPLRDDTGWCGWVGDLPRREAGPDGYVVTANERATPDYDRIGTDFAPPFRRDRIVELLDAASDLTTDDAVAVLGDVRQNAGRVLLDVIAALDDLPTPAAQVRDRLLAWDRRMDADSPGAALFGSVRARVVGRICAAPALAGLADPTAYGTLFAAWLDLPARVTVGLHVILAADRPFGLDVAGLVRAAVVEESTAGEPPSWGERHRFRPAHLLGADLARAPATGLPGDADCVVASGWWPRLEACVRGPVARYAWDLADRQSGGWVVPLGAAADPDSPHHHDQHEAWAAGRVLPIVTDWSRLAEEGR